MFNLLVNKVVRAYCPEVFGRNDRASRDKIRILLFLRNLVYENVSVRGPIVYEVETEQYKTPDAETI